MCFCIGRKSNYGIEVVRSYLDSRFILSREFYRLFFVVNQVKRFFIIIKEDTDQVVRYFGWITDDYKIFVQFVPVHQYPEFGTESYFPHIAFTNPGRERKQAVTYRKIELLGKLSYKIEVSTGRKFKYHF
jgi:hypothetical protein